MDPPSAGTGSTRSPAGASGSSRCCRCRCGACRRSARPGPGGRGRVPQDTTDAPVAPAVGQGLAAVVAQADERVLAGHHDVVRIHRGCSSSGSSRAKCQQSASDLGPLGWAATERAYRHAPAFGRVSEAGGPRRPPARSPPRRGAQAPAATARSRAVRPVASITAPMTHVAERSRRRSRTAFMNPTPAPTASAGGRGLGAQHGERRKRAEHEAARRRRAGTRLRASGGDDQEPEASLRRPAGG